VDVNGDDSVMGGRQHRDYFERSVAMVTATHKLTDSATLLTRALNPYETGKSLDRSIFLI